MSIYIFSRPVNSGKTTELLQWSSKQQNIYGILMPDINGSRKIFDLHTKKIFDIECNGAVNEDEPITVVGRFSFYTAVFEKANQIISDALKQNPHWLVIDEAGKLEIDGKGLYPSIINAVAFNKNNPGNLLVTVRESLLAEVVAYFNLKEYKLVHQLDDIL
ncbi:MAG: hypothetical protein R2765_09455 [Ferruginibacter sp.]|nr:hypothetical protein [Bacteroidota bacterium]MBX2918004.1 hypothetical protein [Ferruginibacter sp.]MCB0708720.1 hypothetical protein [Chitinophagaceae bacterium]MCC7377760.1 hypothetical protein [Chitinophagaceae bacterium]